MEQNNNFDDKDLFSYDNSNNIVENGETSFDLNSFSSKTIASEQKKKKETKKKKSVKQRVLKAVLTVFLVGIITVSLVVGCFMFYAFTMVDGTMEEDLENSLQYTTTIYVDSGDGNYKEYRRLHGEFNRIWVDYDKVAIDKKDPNYEGIPQMLANAFVAIEDKRFFDHDGVDWKRTMGAFINEFVPIYSSRQGGSTITQQLVKNLTNDRSQKASRKVREIMRARYLEGKYSKDIILECYLNTIPLGHGTYGVEVAANYYFGKTVKDLTIVECAAIAAITKSPSYYSPDDNPEENKERRNTVLFEMYDQGYITEEEYNTAKETELNIVADERVLNQNEVNSYFVDALIKQVSKDLADKYGYEDSHAEQLFYNGGYRIYATVDPQIQAAAESVFLDSATYAVVGKDGKKMTGGITVMDYEGNVKGIVGGIGEKTTNRGFNNATDAVRQPGSTMKPIAAYAPAIEQDLITYSSIVNDTKTTYKNWSPVNWYRSYWGNITVQYALERSVNTIPVQLVNKLTPQTCYDFLTQKLGVTTLNEEDINLSPLGMGGTNGGLTTLESAAAFAVFGNGGLYYEPSFYTRVTDQKGKTVLERETQPKMAISENTATVMN
ncbi:MAG: penicillin-binding protein, partial [Clostridia bacterium]|nr:penicillin-binding protein [Clostridia bacterium]